MQYRPNFADKSERLQRSLTELSVDLRTGVIDEGISLLFSFHESHICVENVIGFVKKFQERKLQRLGDLWEWSVDYESYGPPAIPPSNEKPRLEIIRGLALCNAEDQMLAYISRFPELSPAVLASAYEFLEVARFHHCSDCSLRRSRPDARLQYFRIAQKIRNEHGLERQGYPGTPMCSSSFGDIIRLEEEIENGDFVDFLRQCVALGLVDNRHIENMYAHLTTHSQLAAFQDAVSEFGYLDEFRCSLSYCRRFKALLKTTPTWLEVKKFFTQFSFGLLDEPKFNAKLGNLFGVGLPSEELDEAFIAVINSYFRTFERNERGLTTNFFRPTTPRLGTYGKETFAEALKLLLRRGARWQHRGTIPFLQCDLSILGILLVLGVTFDDFPLEEFLPYICCPLIPEGRKIAFDRSRPVRLSCLAARNLATSKKDLPLPKILELWVKMHGDISMIVRDGFQASIDL